MTGPILAIVDKSPSTVARCIGNKLKLTECSSRRAASEIDQRHPFQVVICDLETAGPRGMTLLRTVRARHPNLAFVMVIEPHELRYGILAMIEGASGYVVRPCGPRALLRSLKTAVKRHQLSRTLTCHPSPRAPHNLPCHSDPEPRKEEESPNFPST